MISTCTQFSFIRPDILRENEAYVSLRKNPDPISTLSSISNKASLNLFRLTVKIREA
jgi:hypothetical protein